MKPIQTEFEVFVPGSLMPGQTPEVMVLFLSMYDIKSIDLISFDDTPAIKCVIRLHQPRMSPRDRRLEISAFYSPTDADQFKGIRISHAPHLRLASVNGMTL